MKIVSVWVPSVNEGHNLVTEFGFAEQFVQFLPDDLSIGKGAMWVVFKLSGSLQGSLLDMIKHTGRKLTILGLD